jgi:dienelactone hydrolase
MKAMTMVFVLATFLSGPGGRAQEFHAEVTPVSIARSFVDHIAGGDYAACVLSFDSTVSRLMPESKVKELWESLTTQSGAFKRRTTASSQKIQSYEMVIITCEFERDTLGMRIVVNPVGKIAGLSFVPSSALAPYQPPSYVRQNHFHEAEVKLGKAPWDLPGTLTLPKGSGPFPAVVLVHGSGPNDRDETIGPNKPFRDLAWGLATQGIAVLRYEKRTREHAREMMAMMKTLTVKEETIDDALSAVSILRKTKAVDTRRVCVLGHSLGAMLIPRIGRLTTAVAGFVLLAGPARPLEDLMLEQYAYIFSLDTARAAAKTLQLDEMKRQVAKIKTLQGPRPDSSETLLSLPRSYWEDLKGYDPPDMARTLSTPLLVLQGGRDYQVTLIDYEKWKAAVGMKPNVHFKVYPALNHLFIEGSGKSTPSEYDVAGHVSEEVVTDITGWIKQQVSR